MLNDKFMAEFCEKLRATFNDHKPDEFHDVIACLDDLGRDTATPKDAEEAAKTILEILEPERVGDIRCARCSRALADCTCTGGPLDPDECTCYESNGGHEQGCPQYGTKRGGSA